MKKKNLLHTILAITALMVTMALTPVVQAKDEIPSEVTLFKNANIFDGKSDSLMKGYDVLVVRNLIKKIAKDIPASGTYELDVTSGGIKKVQVPSGYDSNTVVLKIAMCRVHAGIQEINPAAAINDITCDREIDQRSVVYQYDSSGFVHHVSICQANLSIVEEDKSFILEISSCNTKQTADIGYASERWFELFQMHAAIAVEQSVGYPNRPGIPV